MDNGASSYRRFRDNCDDSGLDEIIIEYSDGLILFLANMVGNIQIAKEHLAKKAKINKVAVSVTPVCAAALVGIGLWKSGILTVNHDQLISSTVESTAYDVIVSADNDTSAGRHSGNNKNTTDDKGETATTEDQLGYPQMLLFLVLLRTA